MAQELKRHHINELIGMIKLKGGIGYPIVYYANEVDAVVAKKDAKIGKLTDKLSKTGGQIKRLADLAHARNIELVSKKDKTPRYQAFDIGGHICRPCCGDSLEELNRNIKHYPKDSNRQPYFVRDNVKEKWI